MGVLGNKFFDNVNSRRALAQQLALQIRTEQRADLLTQKQELDETEEKLDDIKHKYYELLEENIRLKGELEEKEE
jgi:hypothetical protein